MVIGDRLLSNDGTWVDVEDLLDTGEWETVYNLRVADHHTYFVGTAEWGWAAWAHNVYDIKFKQWRIGDAIDKPLKDGSAPSWKAVQSRYWKNRYAQSKTTGEFSAANLDRMRGGQAPIDYNRRTGKWESRELHHVLAQRFASNNTPLNLRELTPDWHAEVDPIRHVTGIRVFRGIR